MRLLYFFADAFIKTFGITQPTEKARQRAAFFILALILLVVAVMILTAIVIHTVMR